MDLERQKQELKQEFDEVAETPDRKCRSCGHQFPAHADLCPDAGKALTDPPPVSFPFKDKFQFISVLGTGGMGAVYKAYQPLIKKVVAIKVLHPHMCSDKVMRRFQMEARAIAAIENQHIVRLLEFGASDLGQPYMVMEFVYGESLASVLTHRGTLTVEESIPIFLQVCDAMTDAHRKGVLHRDLKPSNIMFDPNNIGDPSVKIIDFGIAKLLETEESHFDRLTRTGEIFGSPLYMSPEQARGRDVDQRSDIYSLGCVMYEVLTGCPPIVGATALDTLVRLASEEAPSLSQGSLKQTFAPELEAVVAKCLKKDPEQRYKSMTELATSLKALPVKVGNDSSRRRTGAFPLVIQRPIFNVSPAKAAVACIAIVVAGICLTIFTTLRTPTEVINVPVPDPIMSMTDLASKTAEHQEKDVEPSVGKVNLHSQDVDDQFVRRQIRQWMSDWIFNLNGTGIGDGALYELAKVPGLKVLRVNNTKITGAGLKSLKQCLYLNILDVNNCAGVQPADFRSIGQLHSLQELDAYDMNMGDAGLALLKDLRLKTLRLTNSSISDDGLTALKDMKELEYLNLGGGKNSITDRGIRMLKDLPLEKLGLNDQSGVTDRSVDTLLSMKKLRFLELVRTGISPQGRDRLKLRKISVGPGLPD